VIYETIKKVEELTLYLIEKKNSSWQTAANCSGTAAEDRTEDAPITMLEKAIPNRGH
jgi:hypothetical protein